MYKCNNEALSRNHCCRGQAICTIITYFECVLALDIQHAMRTRYIFIHVLSGCTAFFHFIS